MIRHQTLVLDRPEPLDPAALERALEAALGRPPLRWAITAVVGDRLTVEVTA